MCAAGAIEVRAPRVNDKRVDEATGERKRWSVRGGLRGFVSQKCPVILSAATSHGLLLDRPSGRALHASNTNLRATDSSTTGPTNIGEPTMTAAPPPYNLQPPVPPPGQPPHGSYQHPVPARPTSVLAVVSLISSLLWVFWIGSLVAVITGHLARRQVREQGYGGDVLAVIGLVLGYLSLAGFAFFFLIMGLGVASSH
jgi:hypothetical protein